MARHHIVVIDRCFTDLPTLDFDHTIEYFPSTSPSELLSRIRNATIVVTTDTPVTRQGILSAPNLQLVATNGTGTDMVDAATLYERGIALSHLPGRSVESVTEHALALYYALRRNVLQMHRVTMDGRAWDMSGDRQTRLELQCRSGSLRVNSEETMVVIGFGALGNRMAALGKALAMEVLVAERKGAAKVRLGRVPFQQCLERGTLFFIMAPLNDTTRGMLGAAELAVMDPTCIVVNVGRGGIVDGAALANALRLGRLGGAATDVYDEEPATKENSPLLDPSIPNLLLSPHVAWHSLRTIEDTRAAQKTNLEAFVSGNMINVVIPPPKKRAPGVCADFVGGGSGPRGRPATLRIGSE